MNAIILLLMLIAVWQILRSRHHSRAYYVMKWVGILAFLGYRTFEITQGLRVHPLELLIWLFFILNPPRQLFSHLPKSLLIVILFSFAAILLHEWNIPSNTFNEFKNFMLIVPAFHLAKSYLYLENNYKSFFNYLLLGIGIASVIGILEYYIPALYRLIPGGGNTQLGADQFDFLRANFSHWGAATAGHIIILAIPIVFFNNLNSKKSTSIPYLLLFLMVVLALYITGNRADWLITALVIPLASFGFNPENLRQHQKFRRGLFLFLILGIFFLAGQGFINRFFSGLLAISSEADAAIDSSGYVRQQRLLASLKSIANNFFGVGWGNTGWVHSDAAQITQSIGWLGGLAFVSLLLSNLWISFKKLRKTTLQTSARNYFYTIWLLNIMAVFHLFVNGIYSVVQTGAYYFIVMGLLHYAIKFKLYTGYD